jgi:cytochrome c556
MRLALLAITSAALLTACQQPAEGEAENQAGSTAAANSGTPAGAPATKVPAALPLDPVSGEAAKKLMHDRHENYEKIGKAMKQVSLELKRDAPDLAKVREGAAVMASFGPQMASWFPKGSGPEAGKTEAKAEIWQKPEDFAAKVQGYNQAVTAFQAAAAGSDLAAIRAAHGNLGKSCKACHDPYREEH